MLSGAPQAPHGYAPAVVALTLVAALTISQRNSAQAQGQPDFLLPWQHGQSWLTGVAGFHGNNDAIDFFPPDTPLGGQVKCQGQPDWVFQESSYYVLASAPGVVLHAGDAYVLIDHGDGWLSRYYHQTGFVVEEGDFVTAGQRLSRPSTLGDCSSGPHVHFWVQGPNGETTRDVSLSGIATTEIGTNTHYSDTFNFEPDTSSTPTPTPEPTPEPTPPPETETPSPTPLPLLRGDANCDGIVNTQDASAVVWMLAGAGDLACGTTTTDTDCDALITTSDALAILLSVPGVSPLPQEPCDTSGPTPRLESSPTPTDVAAEPSPTPRS